MNHEPSRSSPIEGWLLRDDLVVHLEEGRKRRGGVPGEGIWTDGVSYRIDTCDAYEDTFKEGGQLAVLYGRCETFWRTLAQRPLVTVRLMGLAKRPRSLLFDRGFNGSLGTVHTDHSAVVTRLESFNRPLFRRHSVTPRAGPILAPVCKMSDSRRQEKAPGQAGSGVLGARSGPFLL